MTHWRKTSRSASGAQPLTGSHGGNAIHTAEIIRLPVRASLPGADLADSRSKSGELFIDYFEVAACSFLVGFLSAVSLLGLGIYFAYRALVA